MTRLVELLSIGIVGLLIFGACVYLFGSYFVMAPHVAPRSRLHQLAAMLREYFYVIITQPLVPLYYFIGRRLGRGDGVPVIFVHGYFQNRSNFWWLARQFRKASLGPLYGFNYLWIDSIDRDAARLGKFVDSVCIETGASDVIVVGHSIGGLVALECSAATESRVARCITVGSPHGGVKWRGPILGKVRHELREGAPYLSERKLRELATPTLSVYSTHDNIVHPPSTSELAPRGGHDVVIDGYGHLSLLYSREVAIVLIDFVRAHSADARFGGG